MTPLTIWTNQKLDSQHLELLKKAVLPHQLVVAASTNASNLVAGGRDPAALQADILHGQPSPEDILESTRVRYVQLTSAGYTRYDKPDFLSEIKKRDIPFCNASHLYAEPCAQHVMAMLLSMARAIPQAIADQPHASWNYLPLRAQSFLLDGQNVAIVGYGTIAQRLIELLAPYRLNINTFRRTVRGDENAPTFPIAELDSKLAEMDIIINILPLSDSTKQFFNRDRLGKIKKGAIYINIGRGDTNDQDAMVDLLKSGYLSKVFLDVTTPEPLPKDHPLWRLPNCHICPHTGGGSVDETKRMITHFAENLKRFANGEKLVDRIV